MKKFEFLNGIFHIAAAGAYGLACYESQTIGLYALLAFAMSGIGVCYVGQCAKSRQNSKAADHH